MTTITNLLPFLISTFFFQISLSANIPVQVDLVFPKNSAIYQPVYPFPVVFAIHNFSTAWKYKPTVKWRLTRFDDLLNLETFIGVGSIGWDDKRTDPAWGPPPDKFLAINSSEYLSRYNQSAWILEYTFFLETSECSVSTYRGERVYFNTSITSGSMPDLTTLGSCSSPVGAITLESQDQTNGTCARLSSPQPDPIPCAFKVDQQAFDQIAKKMVETSKCSNVTWPNSTGIGDQCKISGITRKSGSKVLQYNPFSMGLSIVILAVMTSMTL